MAFSGTQITRLGLSGISRGLYGSFSGKLAAAITDYLLIVEDQVITTLTDTKFPLELAVDSSGGVDGLTITASLRDPDDNTSYLDFNDNTFKTVGWTNKTTSLADYGSGFYGTTLDISAITNFPAANHASIEYDVAGAVTAISSSLITISQTWSDSRALTIGKFIALVKALLPGKGEK